MRPFRLILTLVTIACVSPITAAVLPYGTELEVRLLNTIGSRISQLGDGVEAALITPVFIHDRLLVPAGARLSGTVEHIDRLGLGVRHNVARLDLRFTRLRLIDGSVVPIDARVVSVETARESVRTDGAILGINPTASFSTGVSAMFTLFYLGEPELRLPILGFKFLAARSPDPEIAFPSGTEMLLRTTRNVELRSPQHPESNIPLLTTSQMTDVQGILERLPNQQTTRNGKQPADLVNILVIGSQGELNRSFRAAGWSVPESHGVMALYHMFHCAVERKSYGMLPMSNLELNGSSPDAAFQKNLDTFAKRHHIRLWRDAQSGAWLGAATEDVSYRMKGGHITHATDRHIDNERAKIANDLAFTGCVDKGALIPRASVKVTPELGKSILTDGDIAVLQLNGCNSPRVSPSDPERPRRVRIIRAAVAVGVDIARSNPLSVTLALTKSLLAAPKTTPSERLQATRTYTRPSAIASAISTSNTSILAAR